MARRKARLSHQVVVMIHALHDDISFCRIEDHLIFLDIRSDRYFRLGSASEKTFLKYLNDGRENADFSDLVVRNILRNTSSPKARTSAVVIHDPELSALESSPCEGKLRTADFLEVFVIVCSTRIQLRLRKLKAILNSLVSHREKQTRRRRVDGSHASRLRETASVFRRARLFMPVATCCLLDSLALARFLSRRGLHSDLVFGVIDDPFSAHCWLQTETLVLNDTVGNVKSYTPIRVV